MAVLSFDAICLSWLRSVIMAPALAAMIAPLIGMPPLRLRRRIADAPSHIIAASLRRPDMTASEHLPTPVSPGSIASLSFGRSGDDHAHHRCSLSIGNAGLTLYGPGAGVFGLLAHHDGAARLRAVLPLSGGKFAASSGRNPLTAP